jgi:periplasmic protein TonB
MAKDEFANANSPRLWVIAATCAIALHVGCVALVLSQSSAASDDAMGAPAIEVGLELLATRTEPTDLPPGPDSEASVASAPAVEQKVLEETELPKEQPTETEDPDRAVALKNARTPNENDPKPQPVEAFASMQSAAAEARATPGIEDATISTRSTAPAQGTGRSNELARVTWQKRLIAHLDKHKRYPSDRSMKDAEIVVGIVLDRMGRVVSTSIITGSGDTSFDDAALAMMRRADPVPAPPPVVADAGLNFTLPVVFRPPTARTSQR